MEASDRDRLERAIERAQNLIDGNRIFDEDVVMVNNVPTWRGDRQDNSEVGPAFRPANVPLRYAQSLCTANSSFCPDSAANSFRRLHATREESHENPLPPNPLFPPTVMDVGPGDSASQVGIAHDSSAGIRPPDPTRNPPSMAPLNPVGRSAELPPAQNLPPATNLAQDQRNLLSHIREGKEKRRKELETFERLEAVLEGSGAVDEGAMDELMKSCDDTQNRVSAVASWINQNPIASAPQNPLPASYAVAATLNVHSNPSLQNASGANSNQQQQSFPPLPATSSNPRSSAAAGAIPKSRPAPSPPMPAPQNPIQGFGNLAPLATAPPLHANAAAPQVSPSPLVLPQPSNNVGHDLLRITAESRNRDLIISSRPPIDQKYSGNSKKIDFEAHLNQFEMVTNRQGVSDWIKFLELPHWFVGPALSICNLYKSMSDAGVALQKAKDHLKRTFGRQSHSAQQMLNELLNGKKIQPHDSQQLRDFIIALEGVHVQAVETGRENTFDSQDIISNILHKKVEFLQGKWAERNVKIRHKWDSASSGSNPPDPTFKDFLNFLNLQSEVAREKAAYKAPTAETADVKKEKKPSAAAAAATSAIIAPHASVAAASSQRNYNNNNNNRNNNNRHNNNNNNNNNNRTNARNPHRSNQSNAGASNASATSGPAVATRNTANVPSSAPPPAKTGWSCWVCTGSNYHSVDQCAVFTSMSVEERCKVVKKLDLCTNCLRRGHVSKECTRPWKCAVCDLKHHTTVHRADWAAKSRASQNETS